MTDIQQWRRMIQPARTRTPAVEHEEAEAFLSPTTSRKTLKPKFSSYFTQHANTAGPSKKDATFPGNDDEGIDWPSWPAEDPYSNPDADVLIDSVMCRILSSPYEALNPRFNGALLQIFEGFRVVADDNRRMLAKSEQDADRISEMERVMQKSARQWDREKQEYKAEIKRLELLLANGQRGLAEVTLARQDSLLRLRKAEKKGKARKHDTLETIFQFMEKNKRVEEKVWSSQRGKCLRLLTSKPLCTELGMLTSTPASMRRKSPSADMRRLSKTLMSQPTSYPDLPPGTLTDGPSTLAEASYLDARSSSDRNRAASEPKTSFSEDGSISTFSCAGDLLPDEAASAKLVEAAGSDDFVAIKRIAQVLARRRNVDVEAIMPKLLDMFAAQSLDAHCDTPKISPRAQSAMGQSSKMALTRKNIKLMAKASGFFHKLKPQLNVDTTIGQGRRFSFEAGDDSTMSAPVLHATPRAASSSALATMGASDRVLRKSASTPLLAEHTGRAEMVSHERALSPVEQSPTGSTPESESRRASKIPTPSYGTLARPRQDRESSESSLLTAIRYSENNDRRSNSISSSGYSSPSASRIDLTAGSQGTTSNRLLDHTKALRGNAFAAAAATRAVENTQGDRRSDLFRGSCEALERADSGYERVSKGERPANGCVGRPR